ncbi:MAG TPA: hypothetical protein VEC57_05275 [Candidatus Limnocylindrales bacterium]|nr:hypothetical protein [Candidatus Limnocylindrales bacterium]
MTTRFVRFIAAASLVCAAFAATPIAAMAANGDCGQPVSTGNNPTASDALAILKEAVGQATACDTQLCICDVNGNGAVQASDALQTLKRAVNPQQALMCDCEGECNNDGTCDPGETEENCPADCGDVEGVPCTSAQLTSSSGSDLDSGWTGIAHNSDLIEGASVTFRTLRRCGGDGEACEVDADCGAAVVGEGGEAGATTCEPTCDCLNDHTCEITGPTGQKNCLTTLVECNTNADCAAGVACVNTFGPPLPLSSAGNPVCVVTLFDGPLTGTANTQTGEAVTQSNLKSRVFLGISIDQPCPRCGRLDQDPEIGDQFTCEGGQFPGAACVVEGVSPDFGGVSRDCPPALGANISGAGLAIRFSEVTTGTTTKTAQLPCANFSFQGHPSRDNAKCIDKVGAGDPTCSSNADCKRCTGDPTITCTSNAQCTGNGTCAEAPDQPVTCGYWCHCGFCDNNPALPCFENGDCPNGQTCVAGTGSGTAQNAPQQKPNDCSMDKFICGGADEEKCENTLQGSCEFEDFRNCQDNSTCQAQGAGDCIFDFRSCFESQISRTGEPSPLGSYCEISREPCTNADCGAGGDCVSDASVPETVALFCVPATSSSTINSAGGITGPGAVRLNSFVRVCRCGDGEVGCDEECDDGNQVDGDSCSYPTCQED